MGFLAFCQAPSKPPKSQFGILEGRRGVREKGEGAQIGFLTFCVALGKPGKKFKLQERVVGGGGAGANPAKIPPRPQPLQIGYLAF